MPTMAERVRLRLQALARTRGQPKEVTERHALWRKGHLAWKLDPKQRELYEQFKRCATDQGVIEGARKLGKTYLFGVIALETGQQNPGKQINWSCGTAKACRGILVPILEEISQDAPSDCKGRYDQQAGRWLLPNGAFIQIFSSETKQLCERGRGPSSVLNIVDEAGFVDLLEYLLDSIFGPQMRRVRRVEGTFVGMTMLCSTTPYTPAHPFCVVADAALAVGAYARRTIYDSGFETKEEIERYIAKKAAEKNLTVAAFKATSTFRREFMSERVVDSEKVVFPEFSFPLALEEGTLRICGPGEPAAQALLDAAGQALTVEHHVMREWRRPVGFDQFIHKRTAIDPGGTRDPTGILAGYTDFTHARVVIEGERLLKRPNTKDIFEAVVELETELWGLAPDPPPGQPYLDRSRISRAVDDPTGRITLDLWELHKLQAMPAIKNDRNASIGLIRTWLVDGTLVIHPRCVVLRRQLRTALNNKTRTDFERTDEGHCDVAASLMYFCRGLSLTTNPFPADFSAETGRTMPDHHPLMARREQMGNPRQMSGLAGALLSGNRFVQGQLRRRR